MRREVLVVAHDRVGPAMAGPGVRAAELARALAEHHEVRLAAPLGSEAVDPEIAFFEFDGARGSTLREALRGVEVVLSDPLPPAVAGEIEDGRRRWIVDLYNPEPFEGLESHAARGRLRRRALDMVRIDRLLFAARTGSAFVCANERQRDMWLGFLAAERRLESRRYDSDPEGRDLIGIVPFGVPAQPPRSGSAVLRGELFADDAKILLWSGGLWDWLDPLTVLRALAILRQGDDRWACAFIGTVRPVGGTHFTMVERARALADQLGLEAAGAVRFLDWLPYAERATPLLEADAAICAHFATMETRFAVRTRLFDALWAGLPIVTSDGDHWADLVRSRGLGATAPAEDPEALADAAKRVVERGREGYAGALGALAGEHRWPEVAKPLARLIDRAADLPAARAPLGARFLARRHVAAQRANRAWRRLAR